MIMMLVPITNPVQKVSIFDYLGFVALVRSHVDFHYVFHDGFLEV